MDPSSAKEPSGTEIPARRGRGILVFLLKAAVTVSLITWLIRSGSLQFERLRIFIESPRVLLISLVAWLLIPVGMTTIRWRILLQTVGARVAPLRGLALQITALFFNGLVPGNVGGDFVKNQAVLGNQPAKMIMLVVVERTVGLISLVWAGGVGVVLSLGEVRQHPELFPVALAVLVLVLGSIVGPLTLYFLLRPSLGERDKHVAAGGLLGFFRRGLHSLVGALQLVVDARGAVMKGLLVSFIMHLGNVAYFLFLTRELGNPGATYSEVAMVFPLGMLTLILPISVSGLGVGHVMFNELFRLLGLSGGATIFNVYIVAQLVPCVTGAIPYVFMKGQRKPSTTSTLPRDGT